MPADIHTRCGRPVALTRDYEGTDPYYVHLETGTTECPNTPDETER